MSGARALVNVLIIDDSAAARASIAATLRTAGFGVFELSSAIGATRTILRNNVVAAIVDLSMPGLSGDKLVGLLRANSRLSDLVLIVVSGQESQELQSIMASGSVDGVLAKRDASQRLLPLLASLLSARGIDIPVAAPKAQARHGSG